MTGVNIARVREAMSAAVERTSLRAVAEQVGIHNTGLLKILRGAEPRSKTREKLMIWYVQHGSVTRGPDDLDALRAAVHLLTSHLPHERRPEAVAAMMEGLRMVHASHGISPPGWIRDFEHEQRGG